LVLFAVLLLAVVLASGAAILAGVVICHSALGANLDRSVSGRAVAW
jgi:hypothetical protein